MRGRADPFGTLLRLYTRDEFDPGNVTRTQQYAFELFGIIRFKHNLVLTDEEDSRAVQIIAKEVQKLRRLHRFL